MKGVICTIMGAVMVVLAILVMCVAVPALTEWVYSNAKSSATTYTACALLLVGGGFLIHKGSSF